MHIYEGQDLTKIDFAFDDNEVFIEQIRRLYYQEQLKMITGKGVISRLLHKIAKIPMHYWF